MNTGYVVNLKDGRRITLDVEAGTMLQVGFEEQVSGDTEAVIKECLHQLEHEGRITWRDRVKYGRRFRYGG